MKINLALRFLQALVAASVFGGVMAYADGFDMAMLESLTVDAGKSQSEVEALLGAPFTTVDIAKSEHGCVEGWMYTEVIMGGRAKDKVKGVQMLTVWFDEDGYVCSTYITDGGKMNVQRNREKK